jgi:hypothetical protein
MSSCTGGKNAVGSIHKQTTGVLKYWAENAGKITKCPPNLQYMIGESYPLELLSSIFPKKPNKVSKGNHELVVQAVKNMKKLNSTKDRLVLFKRTMSEIKLMRKEDCAAIQPDLAARDYSSKSEEQIIDTTFVHTTCSSYAEAQRKELEDTTVAGFLLHDEGWCPSGCIDNTPAVVNRAGEKHTKYGSIEYLANLQAAVKKSSKSVKFVPAVMTHRGEFGGELLSLIEDWTSCFRVKQSKIFDLNGKTLNTRVQEFRNGIKDSLIRTIADGVGFSLVSAWLRSYAIFDKQKK